MLARLVSTRRFISAMPTNLYGSMDNFDLQASHVVPGEPEVDGEAEEGGQGQADQPGDEVRESASVPRPPRDQGVSHVRTAPTGVGRPGPRARSSGAF